MDHEKDDQLSLCIQVCDGSVAFGGAQELTCLCKEIADGNLLVLMIFFLIVRAKMRILKRLFACTRQSVGLEMNDLCLALRTPWLHSIAAIARGFLNYYFLGVNT